jgi:hypothetical protein
MAHNVSDNKTLNKSSERKPAKSEIFLRDTIGDERACHISFFDVVRLEMFCDDGLHGSHKFLQVELIAFLG